MAMQLGIMRGQVVLTSSTVLRAYVGEEVILVGRLEDDTSIARQLQTEFHLKNVHILDNDSADKAAGKVVVYEGSATLLSNAAT